jgi:hypothetical protein
MIPRHGWVLLLACLVVGAGWAQENLLKDGGFEASPSGWQARSGAEVTDHGARSGTGCLRLSGTGQVDAFCGAPSLQPGQFYRVDAWARTRGLPNDNDGYAAIYMDSVGSFRANLDDHDWEPVTAWFQAKDDKPFRLYFILSGLPQGEIFFDDVSLRPCADPNLGPVTFEDGTTLGIQFYGHPGTVARVVLAPTPDGTGHCLLAAPASLTYKLPHDLTSGLVEFCFTLKLQGPATFSTGGLRLDFVPLIVNCEDHDGTPVRQSLGAFATDHWYHVRGIINLDTQRYDLMVTDFEDPLSCFTRKQLRLAGKTDKVTNCWLNGPKAGGLFDDIYLGPPRVEP